METASREKGGQEGDVVSCYDVSEGSSYSIRDTRVKCVTN